MRKIANFFQPNLRKIAKFFLPNLRKIAKSFRPNLRKIAKCCQKTKNSAPKIPFRCGGLICIMHYALLNRLDSPLDTADGFVLAEVFEDVEDVGAIARAAEQ